MKIKNENVNINEAIIFANYNNLLLKRRNNGLLLSDYQVKVLLDNGIEYSKYNDIHELLLEINFMLQNQYQDELDVVASQIGEMLYYLETKK